LNWKKRATIGLKKKTLEMETLTQPDILTKTYSDVFLKNKDVFFRNQSDDIKALKNLALEDFQKLGIPSKKSERYKYTDLHPFFNNKYGFVLEPDKLNIDISQIFKCDVPQLDMQEIILINGFYYYKNSVNGFMPDKVWIGSLQKAITEIPGVVTKYMGKAATSDDGVIALNTALFRDGIFVYVPKGVELKGPLQIINVLLSQENLFVTQRNLIVLEENSVANVVFCDHTLSPSKFLTNSVTEIFVGENAHLDFTNLQNEHNNAARISNTFIYQQHSSNVNATTLTLNGGMVRNNIKVKLDGEGAENSINGLFLTDKTQHVDNYIFVEHAKPHCHSSQLIKGVLDDSSTGSFNGRILVSKDAQKTVAYQKSSNLLLTSEAKMNTRPQLEIYADDVKCSHGATVGQLDQEALFYMRSRGIGKEEARLLLMYAFAHEIIQNIKVDNLRFRLDEMVNKRLRKELSRCHNCQAVII
jgi:Fe-S cluster assembly protein SufD